MMTAIYLCSDGREAQCRLVDAEEVMLGGTILNKGEWLVFGLSEKPLIYGSDQFAKDFRQKFPRLADEDYPPNQLTPIPDETNVV